MNEESELSKAAARGIGDSVLFRYGTAVVLSMLSVFLDLRVPGLMEAPYFLLLAAVVLSAFYGGVGPSILSLVLCNLVVFCVFLGPEFPAFLKHQITLDEVTRVTAFGWVALILCFLITGSNRSKAKLWDNDERYRALIQTVPDAIASVNSEGSIIYVSPAAEYFSSVPANRCWACRLVCSCPDASAELTWLT